MAKRQVVLSEETRAALESEESAVATAPAPAAAKPAPVAASAPASATREVQISVPLQRTDGYAKTHIDYHVKSYTARQAWRDLFDGLQARGERLSDGRYIDSQQRAIEWLLERLADSD